eukprot:CAMPEP_0175142064 /NCGR_PEP_ID=MMETSP0087-20121206/12541_1 /TAXON_ID=136419 /ORGANISM="Unknown Unknown, Strain D1" /LENGTH=189 /DNA_ID=CAMNT_0016425725 /DNA_START=294 /DNA_END=863 /DNA_ORIENTATION=+
MMKPESYHQLLCLLCPDFPFSLVRNASRITIEVVDSQAPISFGIFSKRLFILFFFSEFMNQAALAFRTIDKNASGKVSREVFLEYLDKILQTKSAQFSCPAANVLKEVLNSLKNEVVDETSGTADDEIMFNSFCVSLFEHSQVETALHEPPSYANLRRSVTEISKMLEAQHAPSSSSSGSSDSNNGTAS